MSNDLAVPQMVEGQASPEVTVNDATAWIANAMSDDFAVNLTSGNVSVTATQYRNALRFLASGVATTGRTVTFPAKKRTVIVASAAANTDTISIIVGSTTLTMQPGDVWLVHTDGTTNGLDATVIGSLSGAPVDMAVYVPGVMSNAQTLLRLKAVRAFSLPLNLAGSYVNSSVAATASTVITFKKNGASIGTATFAISGTVATFSVTATSFVAGDLFSIHGPATADATVADVAFGIKGSR